MLRAQQENLTHTLHHCQISDILTVAMRNFVFLGRGFKFFLWEKYIISWGLCLYDTLGCLHLFKYWISPNKYFRRFLIWSKFACNTNKEVHNWIGCPLSILGLLDLGYFRNSLRYHRVPKGALKILGVSLEFYWVPWGIIGHWFISLGQSLGVPMGFTWRLNDAP